MAGNKNSGNRTGLPRPREDKPFADALRLAINRAHGDRKRLDNVANALVSRAESGDVSAILAIADRLDGKPVQQIESHNVNENHYVRAPEKASKDDWQQYLAHKAKPPTVSEKPNGKSNGSSNGKSH